MSLSMGPGGRCRPRETLVPSAVQGIDHSVKWLPPMTAAPVRYWLGAWAIQPAPFQQSVAPRRCPISGWLAASRGSGLATLGQTVSGKAALRFEGLRRLQPVITGARELVRERLGRHDGMALSGLAFVEAFRFRAIAPGKVRGLDKRPGEIFVAVLAIAFTPPFFRCSRSGCRHSGNRS